MSDKVTNTSSSWISRPVFLSSTFKDMQAERDHLNRVVFPELSERLKKRRVLLEPIDLRQGVETQNEKDEQTRELLTLKVCLDEIDKSRPLLIVLLGDRYGWTPPSQRLQAAAQEKGFKFEVEGKSVTALEIEYGLLKKDKWLRTNSLFLFRAPLPYDKMPKEKAADYSEEYSTEPNAADKAKSLLALKQKIKADPELSTQIRPYALDWNEQKGLITEASLKAWGEKVKEEIWDILDAETKDVEQSLPQTWEEEEKLAIEEFVEDRSRNFVGREDVIKDLLSFARSETKPDADWGATVTAGPGTGKSALFAKLYRELEHDSSVLLLSHAAGITPKSGDVDSMLLRWITELSAFLTIPNPLPEKPTEDDIDKTFASLLHRASEMQRIVVIIDALNQFNPTPRGLHMTWLKRPWPVNAKIIATSIEGEAADGLAQWAGVQEFELGDLTDQNAKDIITAIYTRYHRQVNPKAQTILLSKDSKNGKRAYTNPLWLCLALEQLNLLDEDDFILAQTQGQDPAEQLANAMPGDIPGLYEWIIYRLEKTYGTAWVASTLALVALSRQGWREMDFSSLLPGTADLLFPNEHKLNWNPLRGLQRLLSKKPKLSWDSLKFAVIRRGLRGQLIQSGSHGRWRFMHQQMQIAVSAHQAAGMETALIDTTLQELLHSTVSDYLLSLPATDPLHISETMWHLLKTQDKTKISGYYGGSLSDDELNAACDVLAEWLLDGTETEINRKVDYLGALLIMDGKYTNQSKEIAMHYTYQLNDRIGSKTKLSVRTCLLSFVHQCNAVWAKANPCNTSLERELGTSYERQGTIYEAQGNLTAALTAYQASMKIRETLAASDPGNSDWQQNLAIGYGKLGGIYRKQGNLSAAMTDYQSGMKIVETLAASDPSNADWQRGLSISYSKLGGIYQAQGNLTAALTAYQASMKIDETLAASDPGNAGWQRDLSVSYDNLGGVYKAQGNLTAALTAYQAQMQIDEKLAASDPSNADWQRGLSVSYDNLGSIYQAQGNLTAALTAYQAEMKISETLTASDPGNAEWQRNLSISYDKLGGIYQAQGNLTAALTAYQASMKLSETLAASDPGNAVWQRDLSLSYDHLGGIYEAQGNRTAALTAYQASMKISEKLASSDPGNAEWQRDLWVSFFKIAAILRQQQNKEHLVWYQKVIRVIDGMQAWGMHVSDADLGFYQWVQDYLKTNGVKV